MNMLPLHFSLFLFFSFATIDTQAITVPDSYQATYTVTRGGKVMAEQTTTFNMTSPNHYTLTDVTKGTKGLASLTGFKRTESSHFQINREQIIAVDHTMQQKVAFKSKSFQFEALANKNTINAKGKQAFTLETTVKPISSHMLPLWLSSHVCNKTEQLNKRINLAVLKSKKIKDYQFKVTDETPQFFRLERVYPPQTSRSSEIWLDKNQNCLPVKTRHQEDDEPVVETQLLNFKAIKSATYLKMNR